MSWPFSILCEGQGQCPCTGRWEREWAPTTRVHTAQPHRYGLCHSAGTGSAARRSSSENTGGIMDFSYPVYMDLTTWGGGLRLCLYGITCMATLSPRNWVYILLICNNKYVLTEMYQRLDYVFYQHNEEMRKAYLQIIHKNVQNVNADWTCKTFSDNVFHLCSLQYLLMIMFRQLKAHC